MREENYFEKKLETSKETLAMAENRLEHLDIQIKLLTERFEYDKKIYNDQVIHMQQIVSDMKKRIPDLEKKISQGYKAIDMRTGKGYKSFNERHKAHLQEKVEEAELNYKAIEENYKRKQALRERRKDKLTPEELTIVKAEELKEEMQPKEDLDEVREKERQRLIAQKEFYMQELERLKTQAKHKEAPIETIIKEKKEIANEYRNVADSLNGETNELKLVTEQCQAWIDEYAELEGSHAIWQGRLTNGFRLFCEERGYKLPKPGE